MSPATKLQHALELMELGFAMQRQNTRRRHPEWSEQQVEAALLRWVLDRPLDGPGDTRRPL